MVESLPSKQMVAGSSPVSRSEFVKEPKKSALLFFRLKLQIMYETDKRAPVFCGAGRLYFRV